MLKQKGIGVPRYIVQSVSELEGAGANIFLLSDDPDHCSTLTAEYPLATVVDLPERNGFAWEQYALYKHLNEARYDAFIAPSNFGIPLLYRGQTRLFLVIHDLIPFKLPRRYLGKGPMWATKYLISTYIAAMKADRIITVSDSSACDIARLLHRRNVSVVYPEIAQPYPADCKDTRLISAELGDYFVYNGGADPRKNVDMLLRAVVLLRECLPKIQLVIMGTGYDKYQEMSENLGISDRVQFIGYVSESEKASILSNAACLVYPSSYEGFGVPLVEGMAAGIPVVTGSGSSLSEVGGDAVIYTSPLNEQQLAQSMIRAMSENTQERARVTGREQLEALTKRQQQNTLVDVLAAKLVRQQPIGR
jgi:glycosyltransferase involved in cell wall biosynthesis